MSEISYDSFCKLYNINPSKFESEVKYETYCAEQKALAEQFAVGKHGGVREGAGRKPSKTGKTKVMRIPTAFEEQVKLLVAHLSCDDIANKTSEILMCDSQDRRVNLKVVTEIYVKK